MPTDLITLYQAKMSLKDMEKKYVRLSEATDELASLDRSDRYIKALRRMRVWFRQANFFWKGDQLTFIRAVAAFYSDYGAILRLLKQDYDRGKFTTPALLNQGA